MMIWICRDATDRDKNGIAAAMMILFSGFVGVAAFATVFTVWILLRPQKRQTTISTTGRDELPEKVDMNFSPRASQNEAVNIEVEANRSTSISYRLMRKLGCVC